MYALSGGHNGGSEKKNGAIDNVTKLKSKHVKHDSKHVTFNLKSKSPNQKLQVIEKLEKQNDTLMEELKSRHSERIQRFDRFFNLYEQSINKSNNSGQ